MELAEIRLDGFISLDCGTLLLQARVNPGSDRAQEADDYVDDLEPKLASGIIKCVRHARHIEAQARCRLLSGWVR